MRAYKYLIFILPVFFLFAGCEDADIPALSSTSGYYEIEPIDFSFQSSGLPTLSYTSSKARVMYNFFVADTDAKNKPLFVFFNGGPGCATSPGLFSFNTQPYTLDPTRTGGARYVSNPYSFTQMGNLLYIDAPETGFSYNVVDGASDENVRAAEFNVQNFNPFIDAAQIVRVVLRFLGDHPSIRMNKVIIVGESYGGVRSEIMLNLLLYYTHYKDGSRIYKDAALADEIQNHFEIIPGISARTVSTPERIAQQFGSQILIEPVITGANQDELAGAAYEASDSVIYNIANETGTTFTPCAGDSCYPYDNALSFVDITAKRDVYWYDKDAGYTDVQEAFSAASLDITDVVSMVFNKDISSMTDLGPSFRENAYRYIESPSADIAALMQSPNFDRLPKPIRMAMKRQLKKLMLNESAPPDPNATIEQTLGALNAWDDYMVICSPDVNYAFYVNSAIDQGYDVDPMAKAYGDLFLQDLALVNTFITNADLDLVVYSAVLPGSLDKYPDIVDHVDWIYDTADDSHIDVYYKTGSLEDVTTPDKRTIYFPGYSSSGHMVTLGQPEKFFNDVQRWVGE